MFLSRNRYEERTGIGEFGLCDECGQPIESANIRGPRDAWQPVRYVVILRGSWFTWTPRVLKYHLACAARVRSGSGERS